MNAQQAERAKQGQIKELVRRPDKMISERSSTSSAPPSTEAEVEQQTAELAAAVGIARETATGHAEGREQSPALSAISSPNANTIAIVRLPPAEDTMPDVGSQTDLPRPPPPSRNKNQERKHGRWTSIHGRTEPRAMRRGLVNWDSRAMSCVGNGNLTLSEATQPPSTNLAAVADIRELSHRIVSQKAQTERLRARGTELASMAGATAFDHAGALTVFTSSSGRNNQRKRARKRTRPGNWGISLPDKFRWDVTDLKADEVAIEEKEVELPIGKIRGYQTIYSYFEPVFRDRQGVLPERVTFEMRNGYFHIDGLQVPHLPGFEYGVGYADEETSQRMIRETEWTPRQMARTVRNNRTASQFGQFVLDVATDARERLRDPRNKILGRFYCEGEDCRQSYNLESDLRFHRRKCHRPGETHRREECPKSLRQENRFERHGRIHERQRREALVEAVFSHESAHTQGTSEGAVLGTTPSSEETLPTFEALADSDGLLLLRLDDTEDAQPQVSMQNDNAEEKHTATKQTDSDPPISDDGDDSVGLRGGYLEEPRILYGPDISYLIDTLKYSYLYGFDLSYRFNQPIHVHSRPMIKAILFHEPNPEDETWKVTCTEWRAGLLRVACIPLDCIAHAQVTWTIDKIRELDLVDAKLAACLFGLNSAKKRTPWAMNGHIFEVFFVQSSATDKSVFTAPVPEASIRADAPDLDQDVETIGLRGGADHLPCAAYLLQILGDWWVDGNDAIDPLLGRKVDALGSINLKISDHTLTEDHARWKIFWKYRRENGIETIPRPAHGWALTTEEVAAATMAWLRKLKLEGPQLDACLYGLRVADTAASEIFWLVVGPVLDLLSTTNRINCLFPNGAGLAGANDGVGNVRLKGGAKETRSTSKIVPMKLGSTIPGPDRRVAFPPIGQELVYLAAFHMAESFDSDKPHPSDKDQAWEDFWDVYWHSIPGASESTMFRSAEVDATIQEMESRDLIEPVLSACLVGLKLAREKTFWEVQDAIMDVILARKATDVTGPAMDQPGPVTDEASGGVVETPYSDDDAEKVKLRAGAPEWNKLSYLVQKLKDRRVDEHDSYASSGRRRRPPSYRSNPQSLDMGTSNAPGKTHSRKSSIGSQQAFQNYFKANSSMSESSGKSRKKVCSNSSRAKAPKTMKGSRKREREDDADENDWQYPERQKKRKFQSKKEAQDALQAGGDDASKDVGGDTSLKQSEGKRDDNRHSCARQRASNSRNRKADGYNQPLSHSLNQDAKRGASTKIRTFALLKYLNDFSDVHGDLKAFSDSLYLFITKSGLTADEMGFCLENAGQKVLGLSKDAVTPEAQEKLCEAVKPRNAETTEEAKVYAQILNPNMGWILEVEEIRPRHHNFANRDSGLYGGAGDSAVPTEENSPSQGRTIAPIQNSNDLNGLRRHIRDTGEFLHAFIAKFGMVRTRVCANFDRAEKETLDMLQGLTRQESLTQSEENIGQIFEVDMYGKTPAKADMEMYAKILSLAMRARIKSEGRSRKRFVRFSQDCGLRGGAGIYDSSFDLPTGEALLLRGRDDYKPSRQSVHEPITIDGLPFGSCSQQKGNGAHMNTGQCSVDVVFAIGGIQQRSLNMKPEQASPELVLADMKKALQTNGKVSKLRGGYFLDSGAMQRLAKQAEQHTVDGSNVMMSENHACQYDCGSDSCSTHQVFHNVNHSTSKSILVQQPTAGSRLRKEVSTSSSQNQEMTQTGVIKYDTNSCEFRSHDYTYCTSHEVYHNAHVAQPRSNSHHALGAYSIAADRALLFERPTNQPRQLNMAWQSNVFSTTNGAVGLIGQTDMCYYPDPVNSQFCTTHHIIHGGLRHLSPSNYIVPYALDETTLMAQARALTLGSPYALDETTVMAQARAITLGSPYALDERTLMAQARAVTIGFVKNGVPDVAMLQHQARVHASQAFGQNTQCAHEMQPSARSRLWAAQGGAYFGRGLQQTPASSRIESCSQNTAQKVKSEWGEAISTLSVGMMSDGTLVPGTEAGNWELRSTQTKKLAALSSNTRKRQRTADTEEDEGYRADASAPNQNATKRTKGVAAAALEQRKKPSIFADTPSSFATRHDDWEMVDAPLAFDQILENERRLIEGRTDVQDCLTGGSFVERPGTLRGGCLDDDAHDARSHGALNPADVSPSADRAPVDLSAICLAIAQQSTRQFTSCIGQVETGRSRIPSPVSQTVFLEQLPLSEPHGATTGLDGTTEENQNPFVEGEIAEAGVRELNTDGFNVGFEVEPFNPEYPSPSTSRDAIWRDAALRRMDEVLSTHRGQELVRSYRNEQRPSVPPRRQRLTSSPVSPLSRPTLAGRESFESVASAQIATHALDPTATVVHSQQYDANPLRQPLNPPSHALLDHPFIRSANGEVQFQVPFHSPNPLRPLLQPRELSSPRVYPVFTPRATTPEAHRRIAQELLDAPSLSDVDIALEDGQRMRERLQRRLEARRAITPPPRQRIAWGDESDIAGSLSDLPNPEEFARRSRQFRRGREALRRGRARQEAGLAIFSDLSRLPRPEMSGGSALIEDDIWERNHRLAREAESAPLYLRSFVDALPSGTIGGVHGDPQAYIDSLMHSTAASGHGAGERGGVPEGVWYSITFERRLDSKPAPKRSSSNRRCASHRRDLESDNDYSGAESDEDEEYIVYSWDVQIPAGGMKDLLRSTGTDWGIKAVRARDWALEEMARDPKGEECTEAIEEWWEAVRGGASRDERCKAVGVRVLEP